MDTMNEQINDLFYFCEKCNYKCYKNFNFKRHLSTDKHKILSFGYNVSNLDTIKEKNEPQQKYSCKCGRQYKYSQGLSKHKKTCKEIMTHSDVKNLADLVLEVVKQNQELINQNNETQKQNKSLTNKILQIYKNGTNNTIINTNSHNKTFNLQFFLNETCKNAMNIMEFVDSIKLQLSDLENVGKLGYVEGISNIIVKNLKDLDITERPIHCTDKKREVLYIKDEDKWEKEDEEKKKIRNVIKKVANKNVRLIKNFKEIHPDCGKSTSKFSDQYDKIIVESMGGSGDNDAEKEEKIIQKISKIVTIEKDIII